MARNAAGSGAALASSSASIGFGFNFAIDQFPWIKLLLEMEQAVAAIDLLEGLAGNTEPAKCCQLLERLFGIVHPVLDRDVMRRFDTKAAAVQEHSSRLEALRVFQIGRDGLDILDDLK